MSRKPVIVALILALSMIVAVPYSFGQKEPTTRTLVGQIMKDTEAPLPGAVVYLKNTKTMAVRSVISDDKGNYRFTSLSPNIDYEVHAEYRTSKSDTKTLSSFDSRSTARINLKINAN